MDTLSVRNILSENFSSALCLPITSKKQDVKKINAHSKPRRQREAAGESVAHL